MTGTLNQSTTVLLTMVRRLVLLVVGTTIVTKKLLMKPLSFSTMVCTMFRLRSIGSMVEEQVITVTLSQTTYLSSNMLMV